MVRHEQYRPLAIDHRTRGHGLDIVDALEPQLREVDEQGLAGGLDAADLGLGEARDVLDVGRAVQVDQIGLDREVELEIRDMPAIALGRDQKAFAEASS